MGRKNGVRCRCSNSRCRARRTVRRPLLEYIRPPKCRVCGSPLTEDAHRNTTELRQRRPCCCDGYWFPHRPGGGVWCEQHPEGPSRADFDERYSPAENVGE